MAVYPCDASILSDYVPYIDFAAKPGFEVTNSSYIYPIATGLLHIPHTHLSLTTDVFNDADLSGNLFGLALERSRMSVAPLSEVK